jgi:hypothetical protein
VSEALGADPALGPLEVGRGAQAVRWQGEGGSNFTYFWGEAEL